jgi:hypothetical protein
MAFGRSDERGKETTKKERKKERKKEKRKAWLRRDPVGLGRETATHQTVERSCVAWVIPYGLQHAALAKIQP